MRLTSKAYVTEAAALSLFLESNLFILSEPLVNCLKMAVCVSDSRRNEIENARNIRKMAELMRQCVRTLRYMAREEFVDGESMELARLADLAEEVERRLRQMKTLLDDESNNLLRE